MRTSLANYTQPYRATPPRATCIIHSLVAVAAEAEATGLRPQEPCLCGLETGSALISLFGVKRTGHWDDVASVTQKIGSIRTYGIPLWASYLYTITMTNGETAPWNMINDPTFRTGNLIVTRKDRRLTWVTTPVSKTPNISVLTALVSYIRGGVRPPAATRADSAGCGTLKTISLRDSCLAVA